MTTLFPITYYTGKTSQPYKATLQLSSRHWYITYVDEEQRDIQVNWLLGAIEMNELSSSLNVFKYGEFPKEVIECADPRLLPTLKKMYPSKAFVSNKYQIITEGGAKGLIVMTLLVIVLLGGGYFVGLPILANTVANNLPLSLEKQLGELTYSSTLVDYNKDSTLSKLVNDFAQEIDFQTEYTIDVTVVESEITNAFALPGGRVVIFDRLLKDMESPEELAALLAHEVAHIEHRHSLQALCRSLANYLLLSFIFSDANGVAAVLVDNADMLMQLKFSRSLETEADEKALLTLAHNKIDQAGLSQLFETLQKEVSIELEEQTNFLSTHPILQDRIDRAKEAAATQATPTLSPKLLDIWKEIEE